MENLPSWSKDGQIGNKLINARSETVQQKPAFKLRQHLSKALPGTNTGFYEWKKVGGRKQPYFITMKGNRLFAWTM